MGYSIPNNSVNLVFILQHLFYFMNLAYYQKTYMDSPKKVITYISDFKTGESINPTIGITS
ncbi:hypothetical protein FAY30_11885 [Bacillus sp. S3]|nr:hypothetical protein FAY30_11885 [Bacillus sp. S3]